MSHKLLKIKKTRNVKTPNRAHSTDAGIDFFVPLFDGIFLNDLKEKNNHLKISRDLFSNHILLQPNMDVLIPSGIKAEIPENCFGLFLNKSGVATKKKLIIGAQVIDEGYRGEIHIHLINTSNFETIIHESDKIAQMVLLPYYGGMVAETINFQENTQRGGNGFGSTD